MTPDREGDGEGESGGTPDDRRGDGDANVDADDGDPFERLPGADADADGRNPFEHLPAEDAERADDEDPFEEIEADPLSGVEAEVGGAEEAIVPKGRYCESCEYFAEPPEVRCTNAGTEIRELVDMDHFRVFDCPVVAGRQQVSEIVASEIDATLGPGENDTGGD